MSKQDDENSRYEVALTVFVVAEGVDECDAHNVARQAMTEALDTSDDGAFPRQWAQLTTRTRTGKPRTVEVTGVMTTAAAFATGALTISPRTTRDH
jgi:hypothetical protein